MSQPDLKLAMRTLAATTDSPGPLPDADLVWQRAAARARWRQYDLATRSIRLAERVACMVCAVAGILALLTLRPEIHAVLSAIEPMLLRLGETAFAATAVVGLVLVKSLLAEE